MRRERVLYQDKVALGEQAWETYEGAIRTCLKLYENTQDPYYKTLAFHYAEKSKSGALTQNLSDYRAKSFGIIPDALLELETSLKIDRSYYQAALQTQLQLRLPGRSAGKAIPPLLPTKVPVRHSFCRRGTKELKTR
jgi:hypothetical protein